MYLLDSNTCIRLLNNRDDIASQNVILKMRSISPSQLNTCSVVKYELFFGAMKSQKQAENLAVYKRFFNTFYSYDFEDKAALKCSEIRFELYRQGKPIGPYDMMIAAIAFVYDLTLVTANVDEFSRVNGLKWENWEK